jgi:tetratricopeptide (TPR) repeat protein
MAAHAGTVIVAARHGERTKTHRVTSNSRTRGTRRSLAVIRKGASGMPGETSNEVSGVVHGPSVQARQISGGVHIHQPTLPPSAPLPPPAQLPPPGLLVDRDTDRQAMDAARGSGLIVVCGPPGTGKTALAVNWAHSVRAGFPDGVLLADLRGHAADAPAAPNEALGRFLRALGVDTRHLPGDVAELTGLYRSAMIDRRMLVVLDDALNAAQVSPLLPPSPDSLAVVTSRIRLAALAARGAPVIHLGRLATDAAMELLTRIIGDDRAQAAPHAAGSLAELCGGLPLAVCVAGARLAARPRWTVSEMVTAMTAERERLAALATEDDMAVSAALDLSYRALPAGAARLYRLMGLFPGARFTRDLAAAAAAIPLGEAERLLGTLAGASLLEDEAGDQYRFHDLIRLHACETVGQEEPTTARDEAVGRIVGWYLAAAGSASLTVTPYRAGTDLVIDNRCPPADPPVFADRDAALGWLDRELPNVLAVARLAARVGDHRTAWQLADAMWPVFLYQGRHAERLELDRLGLQAARDGGDALGEAKMLYRLGTAVMDAGQLDEAEGFIREALAAWEKLSQPDRVAGSLRRLGYIAMARQRPGEAAAWFTQALAAYRHLADARHTALVLSNLADALTGDGRPHEAITALEEAGPLLAPFPDPYSQAAVLIRLGRAHGCAGSPGAAAGYLDQALDAMREIRSARGEADALTALGDLARSAGQFDEARSRYTQAQHALAGTGSTGQSQISELLAQLDQPDRPAPEP